MPLLSTCSGLVNESKVYSISQDIIYFTPYVQSSCEVLLIFEDILVTHQLDLLKD